MRTLVVSISTVFLLGGSAWNYGALAADSTVHEVNPTEIGEYLRRFHEDPMKVMNTRLATRDEAGRTITDSDLPESLRTATREEIWKAHNHVRDKICAAGGGSCVSQSQSHLRELIDTENQISNFLFETTYLSKLSEMEAQGLTKAQVARKPWSDSFWPTAKGLIARRWLDGAYPDSKDWMTNYTHFLAVPPGSGGINAMAPSEKYDYLMGDYSFRLTAANWNDGKETLEQLGKVAGWTGLCHGWAPASIMTPAPKKSVTVQSPNGTFITFYPSDIKALATEAWGEATPRVKFAGTKCVKPRPKMDENGRVIDPGCFDVNPATWHIGIVNQMGVSKRSFVFDSQYDYQIWNYPIYSYHYRYFNPQTLQSSDTLGGAAVDIKDFRIDKFKKYRKPEVRYVVGIEMDIYYSIETSPSKRPVQEPRMNSKKWVYDLELDASGTIIGGEWYSNFHPDFMWSVPPDGRVISAGEDESTAGVFWDGHGPVPEPLRQAARISSPKMQPVGAVIETLVRLSQEVGTPP